MRAALKFKSMEEVKAALIVAHRNGDQDGMRRLSQIREWFKRKERRELHACRCGARIKKNQKLCVACRNYGALGLPRPKINYRTGKPSKFVRFKDTGLAVIMMQKAGGNATEAARMLGTTHSTILRHYTKVCSEKTGHRRTLTITPEMCLDALHEHKGCWKKACDSLGLLYGTFWRKLRKVYTPAPRTDLSWLTPDICLAAFRQYGSRKAASSALGVNYSVFNTRLRAVLRTSRSESWNTVKPADCLAALDKFKDRGKAAAALGIARATFNRKLTKIQPKSKAATSRAVKPADCLHALKEHGSRTKARIALGISKSAFQRKLVKAQAV